ncbi:WXG100 family type VII secretion target [Nocardiopsis algeriensis]|uniref:Uncharacterized protein YukE n=1 Tax=Nocardiopsis algeriensis TaxID=1478215 RepID=A0A841IKA4_9ACTN|nr:hypothetical protein [Nocardiopsis algeriensis]MBB6119147.1 uncharacterized protein YukE [Nocardiopsis algeriensis]
MTQRTRNTEEANRIAQEAMSEAYNNCRSIYTSVDNTRDQLRVSWRGAAANSYFEALVLWLEELRLITNDMNRMIGTFGGTVQQMLQTEDQAVLTGSSWIGELNPNQSG